MSTETATLLFLFLTLNLVYHPRGSHSQMHPSISINGTDLENNSYIDADLVGMDKEDMIECSTDLRTCCSSRQGLDRGDWYFPNGTRVPLVGDVYETRAQQRVTLYRDGSSPSGIYHCSIPVNDNDNRVRYYIGLYEFGGEISSYLHISGCVCESHLC